VFLYPSRKREREEIMPQAHVPQEAADKIREHVMTYMQNNGMTQEVLAKRWDIHVNTVRRLMRSGSPMLKRRYEKITSLLKGAPRDSGDIHVTIEFKMTIPADRVSEVVHNITGLLIGESFVSISITKS